MTILFVTLVGIYTLSAAVCDLKSRRIPNYLTVGAAIAGLAFHTLVPGAWGVGVALSGLLLGLSLLMIPWLMGGSGGGDVKLLAGLGALLGPKLLLGAFLVSIAMAGVLAIGVLVHAMCAQGMFHWRRSLATSTSGNNYTLSDQQPRRKRVLPFAVPVALGTWILLACSLFVGNL